MWNNNFLSKFYAIFSCVVILVVPFTYYFRHLHQDEGTSLCRSRDEYLSLSKYYYEPSEESSNTYGTLFIEQQPLFYIILNFWKRLNLSENYLKLRQLSLIFYYLGLFYFFKILKRYSRSNTTYIGLSLTMLLSVFPVVLHSATYIREYSFYFCFSVISSYYFLVLLVESEFKKKSNHIKFVASNLILGFTHFFSYILIFSQFFVLLFKRKSEKNRDYWLLLSVFFMSLILTANLLLKVIAIWVVRLRNPPLREPFVSFIYFFDSFFSGAISYINMSFVNSILLVLLLFRILKFRLSWFDIYSIIAITLSFISASVFIVSFRIEEIVNRYYIFVYPLLIVLISRLVNRRTSRDPILPILSICLLVFCLYKKSINFYKEPMGEVYKAYTFFDSQDSLSLVYTDDEKFKKATCLLQSYYNSYYFPKHMELRSIKELSFDPRRRVQIALFNSDNVKLIRELVSQNHFLEDKSIYNVELDANLFIFKAQNL